MAGAAIEMTQHAVVVDLAQVARHPEGRDAKRW